MANTALLLEKGQFVNNIEEPREWFAAYTNSCHEKRVAQHCDVRQIESFLPTYRCARRWKNGCTMQLERPLFPGYVFVRLNQSDRIRALELPGVVSLVGVARRPTPLPESEIEGLRKGIELVNAEPHPYLSVGESAQISAGPLAGMTGIVVRKKNSLRIVLSLDLIMKSISVEVDSQDLRAINNPPTIKQLRLSHLLS
jgi:transcription antitermination factor NusG